MTKRKLVRIIDIVADIISVTAAIAVIIMLVAMLVACKKKPNAEDVDISTIDESDSCVSINNRDFYICSKNNLLWLCEDPGYDCFPVAESPVRTVKPAEMPASNSLDANPATVR